MKYILVIVIFIQFINPSHLRKFSPKFQTHVWKTFEIKVGK